MRIRSLSASRSSPFSPPRRAFALAACGDDDSGSDTGDLGPDPATMAPADAPFYAGGRRPARGRHARTTSTRRSRSCSATEDPSGEAARRRSTQARFRGRGLSYADDIEPWLGCACGGFIGYDVDPSGERPRAPRSSPSPTPTPRRSSSTRRARAATATTEQRPTTASTTVARDGAAVGINGDFLLLGTEQGFKDAVDAGAGDSLADDSDATAGLDEVPDDSIFSALRRHAVGASTWSRARAELPAEQLEAVRGAGRPVQRGPDQLLGHGRRRHDRPRAARPRPPTDAGEPSDLVSTFPSDSWLAFAAADVGEQLETSIDAVQAGLRGRASSRRDVQGLSAEQIDPIADDSRRRPGSTSSRTSPRSVTSAASSRAPRSSASAAASSLETDDEQAAQDAVDQAPGRPSARPARDAGHADATRASTSRLSGAPVGAQVAVEDGKFVARGRRRHGRRRALARRDARRLRPVQRRGGRPRRRPDAGASSSTSRRSSHLVESTGQATSDPDYQTAKPYLDAPRLPGRAAARSTATGSTASLVARRPGGRRGRATTTRGGRSRRDRRRRAAPGVGIDLIEIERVERALARRPRLAERLFRPGELGLRRPRPRPGAHLAARFAAKEAAIKALGGGCGAARHRGRGLGEPPTLRLHGRARGARRPRGASSWPSR